MRRAIWLAPRLENLSVLERFIARCDFLDSTLRDKATLVSTEFFDNIVMHSRPCTSCRVYLSVTRSDETRIVIRYSTRNFDEMLRGTKSARPHYDALSERYRGLGLVMCRNLSRSIGYKKGLLRSTIVIIL